MSMERIAAGTLWLVLVGVAVIAAPPAHPDTNAVIVKMLTGSVDGVNLSLFALFNIMGLVPVSFLVLLVFDAPSQRVPRWPFVVGSFALGAFALVPYLALREWNLPRRVSSGRWLRLLRSRVVGGLLFSAGLALLGLFFVGDVRTFSGLVATQQFPFVMSCDFVALWLAGALLAREECALRGSPKQGWLGLLPVLGLPLVMLVRAPTSDDVSRP